MEFLSGRKVERATNRIGSELKLEEAALRVFSSGLCGGRRARLAAKQRGVGPTHEF